MGRSAKARAKASSKPKAKPKAPSKAKASVKRKPPARASSRTKAGSVRGASPVDAFMTALEHPLKAEIEAVRAILLDVDPRIQEGVKWNAPSYHLDEHFLTFTLRSTEKVQLVFHTGAKVKPTAKRLKIHDPAGLLEWAAKDRAVATLSGMRDIKAKKAALTAIVKQWIAQL